MAYLPNLIREGAKQTKPTTLGYFLVHRNKACAIGAAAVAFRGEEASRQSASENALGIQGRDVQDVEGAPCGTLADSIIHLNDKQGMSREAIAEWLEEKVPDEKLRVTGPTGGPDEDTEEEEEDDRELQPA